MPNKIKGKVCPEEAGDFYKCVGTLETNRVCFGETRRVKTKTRKLVKKATRTITNGPNGRVVTVGGEHSRACKCCTGREKLEAVKVVQGPCVDKCENQCC